MSHLYIWKPKKEITVHSKKKFYDILMEQKELYEDAYSIPFHYQTKEIAGTLIGQITWDQHLINWKPWLSNERAGVAWVGIAENLTNPDPEKLFKLIKTEPKNLSNYDGSYAICTWDHQTESVLFATAPTQSPSLFYTEGPEGFAIGSRGGPLLNLVGKRSELDPIQASLYISWGYLIGDGSLYKGVYRLKSRSVVDLTSKEIKVNRYQELVDLIRHPEGKLDKNTIMKKAKNKFLSRVKRQLDLSENPIPNITGGRDSRLIASAAKAVGYQGDLVTLGSKKNQNAKIGKKVAQRLNLNHALRYPKRKDQPIQQKENIVIVKKGNSPNANKVKRMAKNKERLLLWAKVNEGLETYRHAQGYRDYFHGKIASPYYNQIFHGLGGEVHRGATYHLGKIVNDLKNINHSVATWTIKPLHLRKEAVVSLEKSLKEIDQTIKTINGTKENWLDLFYWQKRMLHWGQDMMSVKSMSGYHWTPLFDGDLIRLTTALDPDFKSSEEFVEKLTQSIAPELKDLPYDKDLAFKQMPKSIFSKISHKLIVYSYKQLKDTKIISYMNRLKSTKNKSWTTLTQFWELYLLDDFDSLIWPTLIDESYVKSLIKNDPKSDTLWSILTVELFHQANC